MKTSIVEIGDLLSPLGTEGVKKQLLRVPGVRHVDVNYAAASATVRYDQTATSLERVREEIIRCGYHCRGELMPEHLCRSRPAEYSPMGAMFGRFTAPFGMNQKVFLYVAGNAPTTHRNDAAAM